MNAVEMNTVKMNTVEIKTRLQRIGIIDFEEDECQAELMSVGMPDNVIDMVTERFIMPLVARLVGTRAQQLEILCAPIIVAYIEGLTPTQLAHKDIPYWVHNYLMSMNVPAIPEVPVPEVPAPEVPVPEVPAILLGDITLYHGTTQAHVESVDPCYSWSPVRNHDFGPGLYVTTQLEQAIAWAQQKHIPHISKPAVVAWPRVLFDGLKHHRYETCDADFKHTVSSLRTLRNASLRRFNQTWIGSTCDVVSGPVVNDGGIEGYQLVLRTDAAMEMLCNERVVCSCI